MGYCTTCRKELKNLRRHLKSKIHYKTFYSLDFNYCNKVRDFCYVCNKKISNLNRHIKTKAHIKLGHSLEFNY